MATPSAVRAAALVAFGTCGHRRAVAGGPTSWWLLAVGAAALAAAGATTGGPRRTATSGSASPFRLRLLRARRDGGDDLLLTGRVTGLALAAGASMGLFACALLDANNLRDIDGDVVAGKRTVAVRLGRRRAGYVYVGLVAGGLACAAACAVWRPGCPPRARGVPLRSPPCAPCSAAASVPRCSPCSRGPRGSSCLAGPRLAAGLWWSS